jgi:hypothetical protein
MAATCFPVVLRRAFLIAVSVLWLIPGLQAAEKEFTPWMSLSEMNAYLEGLDGDKPEGKNFWDRRNWLTGVEGRWEAGIPQYRLSHSPVPECRTYWWFWYFNQDQKSFDRHVHELADEGFTLVHFNSYVRPGGGERFQGVWQKLVPLTGAAPLPPGNYRLKEVEGTAYSGRPVTLVIEGTKIYGHGPACNYKASVRDRYSGSIDVSRIGERTSDLTPREEETERVFLKALEYANWHEKDGRLRVLKNGQTVLRFEPDPAPPQ